MSTTENKEIVLRKWYEDLWDNWNIGVADELFTSDYTLHASGVPAPLNRDAAKQVVGMFGTAFPDLRHTVDEMVAEGNTVAARA
jgi:predicted ester cyclase